MSIVNVHRDELSSHALATHNSQIANKHMWPSVHSKDLPVQQDKKSSTRMNFVSGETLHIFDSQIATETSYWGGIVVSDNQSRESEIFDQPASFSFRRISWTQHTPLAGL